MRFWRYLAAFSFALAATLMLAAGPAYGSAGRQESFAAVRVEKPPAFDASLSDPAWSKGVVAGDFINLTTRQAAGLSTTAYLLYDSHNLYVAFKVSQRGVHLIANQTTNNAGLAWTTSSPSASIRAATARRSTTFSLRRAVCVTKKPANPPATTRRGRPPVW